jgi:tetratricopeptide (TPR) repeat protein
MFCTFCGAGLPDGALVCTACHRRTVSGVLAVRADDVTSAGHGPAELTVLAPPTQAETALGTAAPASVGPPAPPYPIPPAPPAGTVPAGAAAGVLAPGTAFGNRYHIIRLLGMGGMGAVYQAWDNALGVAVALKVIRPEITADPAAARDLERRFKRELLLARQVTHKHVVRIHDLGDIDGIKYLTMPYIQGSDLATVLNAERKLPVPRAVAIARQVASGLQAAHDVGVVHRDLKPANIMIDEDGQAVIMDFGIARSVSGGGATMAGAVVGTLEYMAPEQAMAQPVDHRADIYALGLMMYDMVLGPRGGSRAESAVAELMGRVQKPLPPIRSVDPTLPEALERVIDRCVQPDPAARYQTTAQLVQDLERLDAGGRQTGTGSLSAPPVTRAHAGGFGTGHALRNTIVAAAIVVVCGAAVFAIFRDRLPGARGGAAPAAGKPSSLAILPFRNASADRDLDWLGKILADMIRTELGETPGLRIVPSERLSQILGDLRITPNTEVEPAMLDRVSQFSNAELLLAGQYVRFGGTIRLEATLRGPDRTPVALTAEATSDADVPRAVKTLARALRDNLAATPAAAGAARSTLPGPTSRSMAALKAYSEGEQLARDNKHLEARAKFETASKEDPEFALAFARLAQTYQALGYGQQAEGAARRAGEISEALPAEQRYVVDAIRAGISNDTEKAIEAYERLARLAPTDSQILFDLARLYESKGDLDRARDTFRRVLELDPKYVAALIAIGQVEIRRRDFDEALKHLNPAFSEAVQTGNEPAKGAALHAIGVAFKRLNKPADALNNLEQALQIRRTIGDRRGAAATLSEIGQVQTALQRTDAAVASYDESLKIRRDIGDRRGVGNTLIELGSIHEQRGDYGSALDLYRQSLQIQVDLGNEAYQGLCLHNVASIYLLQARYDDALTYFQQALQIREKSKVPTDVAETLQGLADVQTKIGQLDDALSNYLKALELRRNAGDTRGAATVSEGMAAVFDAQGRYAAALDAHEDALKTFRETKESRWLAAILNGHGGTLVMLGRTKPAAAALEQAAALERDLGSPRLAALNLNTRGDNAFYAGDHRSARTLFEQALQSAAASRSPDLDVQARLNVAKTDVKDGRGRAAVPKLREIAARADSLRLRLVATEARMYLGEALLTAGDAAGARRELDSALGVAEKLGLRSLSANLHYLLATALAKAGDRAGARRQLASAQQVVEALRQESRSDDLLNRADLREIVAAARTLS